MRIQETFENAKQKTPFFTREFFWDWMGLEKKMKKEQEYIQSLFVQEDAILASIRNGLKERGMPQISVPPEVGKLLYLLVKMSRAKKILELGTLAGYSTIWLARALPEQGTLTSIDSKQEHTAFAKENIEKANLSDKVSFLTGDAKQVMDQLLQSNQWFDFFFIDADKLGYPEYIEKAIALSRPGAIIVADNLFFHGRVLDASDQADSPQRLRQANQMLASDPRLESILLPIGDGVGIAQVKE